MAKLGHLEQLDSPEIPQSIEHRRQAESGDMAGGGCAGLRTVLEVADQSFHGSNRPNHRHHDRRGEMGEMNSSVRGVRKAVVGAGNCGKSIESYNSTSTTWTTAPILDCGAPPPYPETGITGVLRFPRAILQRTSTGTRI